MKISAIDSAFERALSAEIAASELLRVRMLAATLVVLLVAEQLLFLFARDLVEQFTQKPLPTWLPAAIIGPFLAYEVVALLVLHYRLARGTTFPIPARLANALIETSLPTVALWSVNKFATSAVAFGTWPTVCFENALPSIKLIAGEDFGDRLRIRARAVRRDSRERAAAHPRAGGNPRRLAGC